MKSPITQCYLGTASQLLACFFALILQNLLPSWAAPTLCTAKTNAKISSDKAEKPAAKGIVEPPIENVNNVTTLELVDKPHDYLNKNVRFTAKFFAFSNLALDYKPALRLPKTHLSFLVLRPDKHVPLPELKLAMPIPKEKDPESQILTALKDGDLLEITGHVFATCLDEPWVDVLRLKKLASAPEEKDKKVTSNENGSEKPNSTKDKEHPTK